MTSKIFHADNLQSLPGIRHGFFTREFGNGGFSGQENTDVVHINRRAMAEHLNVAPDYLLSAYQIHSTDVFTVTNIWREASRPRADALVTNIPGMALGILTADCVPILFADVQAGVIGAAHAGWRGAVGGIIENTVAAMEKLGAARSRICAAIGPCIWQASYEVGPEFPESFLATNRKNRRFFVPSTKKEHFMFDLPGFACAQLGDSKIDSIVDSPADTCADPHNFFSHRYSTLKGEKRSGNLMSAIALEKIP